MSCLHSDSRVRVIGNQFVRGSCWRCHFFRLRRLLHNRRQWPFSLSDNFTRWFVTDGLYRHIRRAIAAHPCFYWAVMHAQEHMAVQRCRRLYLGHLWSHRRVCTLGRRVEQDPHGRQSSRQPRHFSRLVRHHPFEGLICCGGICFEVDSDTELW
jgi:hypothetical protein